MNRSGACVVPGDVSRSDERNWTGKRNGKNEVRQIRAVNSCLKADEMQLQLVGILKRGRYASWAPATTLLLRSSCVWSRV